MRHGWIAGVVVVMSAIALLGRRAAQADDLETPLPSDATHFGFVGDARVHGVALLDATRDFRLDLGNGPVRGGRADAKTLERARAVAARELGRYPEVFLRSVKLAGVVFAADLKEGEGSIPSLPNVGGLLLLDVAATEADLVRGLHHEVYHFADLADDGRLSPDPTWQALNAGGFSYGAGGRTFRAEWAGAPTDLPGFVTAYATSGVEEDKAETFADAMARPAEMTRRAESDAVVRAKLHELRVRLLRTSAEIPAIPEVH